MSNIIIPLNGTDFYYKNGSLHLGIPANIPVGSIDPYYPNLPKFLSDAILRQRHFGNYLADGLQTGHLTINRQTGLAEFNSRIGKSQFIGYVFEAMTVRMINDNLSTIGKNVLCWISHRTGKSTPTDKYIKQYEAIGTGSVDTSKRHSFYFEPGANTDVMFVRAVPKKRSRIVEFEPLTINGSTATASLQVKAITTNVRDEIIMPLLNEKYRHVLTYLVNPRTGVHTYYECMDEIKRMYTDRRLTWDEYQRLLTSIIQPSDMGMDQNFINEYYQYLYRNHPMNIQHDDLTNAAANIEIASFVKGEGLILPSDMKLQDDPDDTPPRY